LPQSNPGLFVGSILESARIDQDWVVSIGTGPSQRPLIAAARAGGWRVLGVDRAPDNELVEASVACSTWDADAVLAAVAAHSVRLRIRAILARTSGPPVITAARLAAHLKVAGPSPDLAALSFSKSCLRQACEDLRIATPPGAVHRTLPPWPGEGRWIVKPDAPDDGKEHVYLVEEAEGWSRAFAASAAASLNGQVEMEAFVPGRDVGLCVAASAGQIVWTTAYEEVVGFVGGAVRGRGVLAPSRALACEQRAAMETAAGALLGPCRASGFVFLSFRVEGGGEPVLFEVNPGLCGDGLADRLFPALWPGADFFALEVGLLTGGNGPFPGPAGGAVAWIDGQLHRGDDSTSLATSLELGPP
jgi:hypothetical protein